MTQAATLEWRRETWKYRRGYLWRLYAPAAVRDAIGGAPCHAGEQIGSCVYGDASYFQDKRGWLASAELKPYDSFKAPVRGTHAAARRSLESIISAALLPHGFTSLRFTESAA